MTDPGLGHRPAHRGQSTVQRRLESRVLELGQRCKHRHGHHSRQRIALRHAPGSISQRSGRGRRARSLGAPTPSAQPQATRCSAPAPPRRWHHRRSRSASATAARRACDCARRCRSATSTRTSTKPSRCKASVTDTPTARPRAGRSAGVSANVQATENARPKRTARATNDRGARVPRAAIRRTRRVAGPVPAEPRRSGGRSSSVSTGLPDRLATAFPAAGPRRGFSARRAVRTHRGNR